MGNVARPKTVPLSCEIGLWGFACYKISNPRLPIACKYEGLCQEWVRRLSSVCLCLVSFAWRRFFCQAEVKRRGCRILKFAWFRDVLVYRGWKDRFTCVRVAMCVRRFISVPFLRCLHTCAVCASLAYMHACVICIWSHAMPTGIFARQSRGAPGPEAGERFAYQGRSGQDSRLWGSPHLRRCETRYVDTPCTKYCLDLCHTLLLVILSLPLSPKKCLTATATYWMIFLFPYGWTG